VRRGSRILRCRVVGNGFKITRIPCRGVLERERKGGSVTDMTDNENLVWMFWCRGLTFERWREECRLVEERFSLFRSFAELPFLGFRGVVARSGCEYRVLVAAEVEFYPKYLPWAFVTPSIVGAREDGKLFLDLAWDGEESRFVDVIEAVVLYIEGAHQSSAETS
jgi:hypothetical protein